MTEISAIVLGGGKGARVSLRPHWPFAGIKDCYVPSLLMRVEIEAGAFSAAYDDRVEIGGFPPFQSQLEKLFQTLSGVAQFESADPPFSVALHGDGLGHIHLMGEAEDSLINGNKLSFQFEFDQTSLPTAIKALRSLNEQLVSHGWLGPS